MKKVHFRKIKTLTIVPHLYIRKEKKRAGLRKSNAYKVKSTITKRCVRILRWPNTTFFTTILLGNVFAQEAIVSFYLG